jgi:histidinol-phosphate aminotransferase
MTIDVLSLATPGVRGLTPYVPGKPVEELERELGVTHAIKLASNENPLGPSPQAMAAIQKALPEIARYPDGGGFALKHALASKLKVAPEQITLGNGSSDVIEFAARIFVAPGDEVVFSQ